MRLIDADALKSKAYIGYHTPGEVDQLVVEVDDIDDAPTVDVADVIKCKNCTRHNMPNCPHNYIENYTMVFWDRPDTWDCAEGERKDNIK